MPLPARTRLGPYEVLAPIGAGGMGEVYRACDARLGRDVALKVLPSALCHGNRRNNPGDTPGAGHWLSDDAWVWLPFEAHLKRRDNDEGPGEKRLA